MQLNIYRVALFPASLAACLLAAGLEAQVVRPVPGPAEIADLLRTEGHAGPAWRILARIDGPQPRETLDALADTLVQIAILSPRDGDTGLSASRAAVDALILAGRAETGIPYPGAAERLLLIAETAGPGTRARALTGLLGLLDRTRTLQHLRQVATSQNEVAYLAVGFLARETGPEGLAILRKIYRQDLVTEPLARRELAGVARYHGWN